MPTPYLSTAALVSLTGATLSARFLTVRCFSAASAAKKESALVTGTWLEPKIGSVKIFDATWFLPAAHGGRDADAEFLEKRIPTALRFDLDKLADPNEKDLPHMLPPLDWFGDRMDEMGVSPADKIVVYDAIGQFSAARAYWTLFVLGGHDVRVLNGGLPLWVKEKRTIESGPARKPWKANPPGTWKSLAKPRFDHVVKTGTVEEYANAAVKGKPFSNTQLVDARPKNRFTAVDPEPRPNLKRGRVPGSFNVPFKDVLNDDGTFKDKAAIQQAFEKAGVDLSGKTKLMTSCGSGTTAAVLTFALQEILGLDAPLYDGSFAEYAKVSADRPVL